MMGNPYFVKYPTIVQPNSFTPPQRFFIMVATEIIAMEKDDGKPSNLNDLKKEEQRNSTTKRRQHFFHPTSCLAISKHVMSNNPPRFIMPLGGESGPSLIGSGPLRSKKPSRRSGPRGGEGPIKGRNDLIGRSWIGSLGLHGTHYGIEYLSQLPPNTPSITKSQFEESLHTL
jgi:hypothetical protein